MKEVKLTQLTQKQYDTYVGACFSMADELKRLGAEEDAGLLVAMTIDTASKFLGWACPKCNKVITDPVESEYYMLNGECLTHEHVKGGDCR